MSNTTTTDLETRRALADLMEARARLMRDGPPAHLLGTLLSRLKTGSTDQDLGDGWRIEDNNHGRAALILYGTFWGSVSAADVHEVARRLGAARQTIAKAEATT